VSIRRACRALRFNLSTYFYRHRRPDQAPLRMRLRELAASRVRYGLVRRYSHATPEAMREAVQRLEQRAGEVLEFRRRAG
jgi:hypothetical protein